MLPESCKTVVVYALDAGGSNILLSFVLENIQRYQFRFILSERAKIIFKRVLPEVVSEEIEIIDRLEPATTAIVFGTGEFRASYAEHIQYAKKMGILSIAWLDHWEHYSERFGDRNHWLNNLPDAIWVCDIYAYSVCLNEGFPKEKVSVVGNPFHRRINNSIVGRLGLIKDQDEKKSLLYICEPVIETAQLLFNDPLHWGFTEFTQMQSFIDSLPFHESKIAKIRIRLHPNEEKCFDKYDVYIKSYTGPIVIDYSCSSELADDLLWADIVVGAESAGLVAALECGKKVVSCMPEFGKKCSLPHTEIIKIHSFSELTHYI